MSSGSYRSASAKVQQEALNSASQHKRQKRTLESGSNVHWKSKGPGANFLVKKFQEFLETDKQKGIDPNIRHKQEILRVFDDHPELHCYIRDRFTPNFISVANKFDVNLEKQGSRSFAKKGKEKYFVFLFYSTTILLTIVFIDTQQRSVPSPAASTPDSAATNKQKVSFGDKSENKDDDDEIISLGSRDTESGWSEDSFASAFDESDEEDSDDFKTPSPAAKTSIPSILKRPISPTANLAKMVNNNLRIDKKKEGGQKTPSKKKKPEVVTKGVLPSILPSIAYIWKDNRRNRLTTIEVHLPSAATEDEVEINLVDTTNGKGPQTLCVTLKYSELFLDQDFFRAVCDLNIETNSTNRHSARADHLLALCSTFSRHNKDSIRAQQDFVLPFRCDNFFNLPIGETAYPNTGYEFRAIPIKNRITKNQESEMLILLITLAEEIKLINQAKNNTPSKKTMVKEFIR